MHTIEQSTQSRERAHSWLLMTGMTWDQGNALLKHARLFPGETRVLVPFVHRVSYHLGESVSEMRGAWVPAHYVVERPSA